MKGLERIQEVANCPMVVAGDFNSQPGSAVHKLLLEGRVDPTHPVSLAIT